MEYVRGFIDFLGLRLRVDIVLLGKADKKVSAWYAAKEDKRGKVTRHTLTVNVGNLEKDSRDLRTLIAHELIHAAEIERKAKTFHGPFFQRTAKGMQKKFKGLKRIYLKEYDTREKWE